MGQPMLFDEAELPRSSAPAAEAAEELPESLRGLLAAGFPGEALERLLEHHGGRVVVVPTEAAGGHWMAETIGLEALSVLVREMRGARFAVPRGHRMVLAARNAAIRRDYDAGVGMGGLVRRYRLTERQVWAVLGRG